jgi:hypothetical protein
MAIPPAATTRTPQPFQWVFVVSGTLTTGANQCAYFLAPLHCRVDEVFCHAATAPSGADIIIDVNYDGTSMFATPAYQPMVSDSLNDGVTSLVDGGSSINKDAVITVDVDQIGSGTAGSDLTVFVRGRFLR